MVAKREEYGGRKCEGHINDDNEQEVTEDCFNQCSKNQAGQITMSFLKLTLYIIFQIKINM